MNYYVSAYAVSLVLSLVCGARIFKRYRNLSGLFFLLFTFFVSAWFILYFLFFSGIDDADLLLRISRIDFGIGLGATYSLFFFIYFFDTKPSRLLSRDLFLIAGCYLAIFSLHAFTDLIVKGLAYSQADKVYREVQGSWYLLNGILHISGVFLFVWGARKQIRQQAYLNRIRLKRILFAACTFMIVCLILQLVLPTFGIWILEKEIVFLYVAFVFYIFLTVRRYYFSPLGYGFGNLLVFLSSVALSISAINVVKSAYISLNSGAVHGYWALQDRYSILDSLIGIAVFYFSYRTIHRLVFGRSMAEKLKQEIQKLEQSVSHTTNLRDLNACLSKNMQRIFKTRLGEMRVFSPSESPELQRYFENDLSDRIFINDVVFIEEKKSKFDKDRLQGEIPEDAFLALPLFDRERCIGAFLLGTKSFGDFYTIDEINALRDFVSFLELHLKYIKTYERIEDLSLNLDKKVDEKTMEYNNLINKQKEFISMISHEIKSPIATAIFQADSMVDDLEQGTLSREELKKELSLLNAQLAKTGELISKIFSVQYFDMHSVTLFREKVQIAYLLETEYEVYSRMHGNIAFINRIDDGMGFAEIDRIQFQQVISNLLTNAVKFQDKEEGVILLEAKRTGEWIHVSVEDNGKGFQGIDIERVFDKYSTGKGESVGLGMGLYLCKQIIGMHGGDITAGISETLFGAKFSIRIPAN